MRKQVLLCFLLFLAAALLGGCQRKRLKEDVLVESFSYETVGMAMGSEMELSIIREGDGFTVTQSFDGGQTVRSASVEQMVGEQVTDILRAHDALSWNGFEKSNPLVMDGSSFILSIAFDDGTEISARGTNSRPKGLPDAMREIQSLFDRFLSEPDQ